MSTCHPTICVAPSPSLSGPTPASYRGTVPNPLATCPQHWITPTQGQQAPHRLLLWGGYRRNYVQFEEVDLRGRWQSCPDCWRCSPCTTCTLCCTRLWDMDQLYYGSYPGDPSTLLLGREDSWSWSSQKDEDVGGVGQLCRW